MASTSDAKPVRNAKKHGKILGSIVITAEELELIKTEFNEKLQQHFLFTKDKEEYSLSNLRSSKCIDTIIQKIKKEEEKSRLDSSYINIFRENYMIVQGIDGKERLYFRDKGAKLKMVLPLDEIFDIFWKKHIQYGHTDADTLIQILGRDYVVNHFAVQTISEVCYTCSGPKKPYYCCILDIISMKRSDFAFSHLMSCQDMFTGFTHLRPICGDNKISEICVELFKIFLDFGPPKQVIISDDVFIKALDQIQHLTTYAPMPIDIINVVKDVRKLNELCRKLDEWMAVNKFDNWCLACYGFQYNLNKDTRNRPKSSYDSVFKKITTCVVEDLTADEVDSSELSTSNDVTLVNKAVSTRSPIDFNAMSFKSSTRQDSPDSHSTDEVQEVPSISAMETQVDAVLESPDSHSTDEVQEIPSISAMDTQVDAVLDSADSHSTDEVQEIPSISAMETQVDAVLDSPDSHSTDEVQEIPSISAMETQVDAVLGSPDSHSSDEVQEVPCTSEISAVEGPILTFETDLNLAPADEIIQCDDKDPLAFD
ncbi:hypothetical protein PYW08_010148 [Mythimna loreyi]|uniref:Uncharacterized protein n=1 Tax=Mythimna loreyi TaxID=667449 RepID=A0ACC2Q5S7_9NEOP|nr:hypothetical protein PYW08_010148 [Mythimna loreyi]